MAMIYFKQPINSALSFIVTLLSIAGLFALLGGSFLFLVQIIIYAGAVVTLILFILMFLNIKEEHLPQEPYKLRWIVFMSLLISPFTAILIGTIHSIPFAPLHLQNFGSIKAVGMELFTQWILPFEMISILLLIALIGVVILAKKEVTRD
ncbi:NADH-quinone oxidoreductase subunit J [Sulfurimonas sp. MAG313]|nr:NADH-quinone oxidoreductase subunit J [Sulfurimonas sp. MAG313]MDF1881326.1 NADH-quinone oxidoreductase subunit J [Sulfurimonas sp. MAG313]